MDKSKEIEISKVEIGKSEHGKPTAWKNLKFAKTYTQKSTSGLVATSVLVACHVVTKRILDICE